MTGHFLFYFSDVDVHVQDSDTAAWRHKDIWNQSIPKQVSRSCARACQEQTSSLDSGTPTAPLKMLQLLAVSPAWLPTDATHSCSRLRASSFTPYLHKAVSAQPGCAVAVISCQHALTHT